jgi:hypothetical protein
MYLTNPTTDATVGQRDRLVKWMAEEMRLYFEPLAEVRLSQAGLESLARLLVEAIDPQSGITLNKAE